MKRSTDRFLTTHTGSLRDRYRAARAAVGDRARGREPAPRARVEGLETVKLPEGKILIPGVIESKSNFIEHPELVAQRRGATLTWSGGRT